MKKSAFLAAAFALFISFSALAQTKMETDRLREVLVKARVLERQILVNIYSDDALSARLNHEVFASKTGKRLSDSFFCLNLSAADKHGKELIETFNVITFPTTILLDKDGKEIDRVIAYVSAGDYIKEIYGYSDRKSDIESLEKYLKSNPRDINTLFALGEKYAYRGFEEKADAYMGRIVEIDPKNSRGYSDRALYTLAKYLYFLNLKNYPKSLALLLELENLYPLSTYSRNADLLRANIYFAQNKKKEAYSALQSYMLKNNADRSARPHLEYARFAMRNDFHIEEGLSVARQGLELNPKLDPLYNILAELYAKKNEYDKAVNAIRRAVEIKSKDPHYNAQLSRFIKERDKGSSKKQ